jgi:hypothetical protein
MLNERERSNVEVAALKMAANVLSSVIQHQSYDIAFWDELHDKGEKGGTVTSSG